MATSKEQKRRVRDYRARQLVHEHKRKRRNRDNIIAILAVAAAGALGIGATMLATGPADDGTDDAIISPSPSTPDASPDASPDTESRVPDPSFAEDRTWAGTLTINDVELAVELDGAAAPQAVSAVAYSVLEGYYDGKTCHRMTDSPGFELIQCGSVQGDGAGDPGFMYGPIENAPADDIYPAGTIAMARQSGNADSNGYQFFLVYADTRIPSDMAGGYTVIGTVTDGLDSFIEDIASLGIQGGANDGPPNEPVSISAFTLE